MTLEFPVHYGGETWQFSVLYERAYLKEDVPHF